MASQDQERPNTSGSDSSAPGGAEESDRPSTLPLSAAERIERVCKDFGDAWRRGERPRVESYLGDAEGQERAHVLRELILLELDYRHKNGERPIQGEYELRFTEDARLISEIDFRVPEFVPERIGQYSILEELGRGGMGIVYLAEQREPIRRRVALKCMTRTDHREFLARFESERQALALMNHPNIAKVHEAGATEEGQPYFAMEHVQGVPIDEYCDQHKLSITQRLKLFAQVCQGIEHAHHRGVIHRDIKPSNILVTAPDEEPIAKIIDFGVAKATNQRLTERTLYTEIGRVIGTPQYMSPEQAKTTGEGVDHRTDIYSLGVVLYELLVAQLPLELDLHAAAFDEIVRRIREDEPPTPSTRWMRLNPEKTTKLAGERGAKSPSVLHELRGDLDWICMKAIEKERIRRYATAAQFAEDIERHLRGEPAKAGPPSTLYRIRKYVRRHRVPVVATCAVVLSLTIGLVASLVFALEARDNAREAQDNLALARSNEQQAKKNLAEVLRLSDLTDLEDYRAEAEKLWPASSTNAGAMKEWLEKAKVLAARIPQHRETLERLREKALPQSDEDRKRDRETHPKGGELAQLQQGLQEAIGELEKLEKAGYSPEAVTLISYGSDPREKHSAYYFRRVFDVEDRARYAGLRVELLADDGAAIYLNGREILRENLPQESITHKTLAVKALSGDEQEEYRTTEKSLEKNEAVLVSKGNIVAVEVHQVSLDSSDLRFDLEVEAVPKGGGLVTLIARGSAWRYNDRGEDLKEEWRTPEYDDSAWPVGRGPFGYGFTEGAGRAAELKKALNKLEENVVTLQAEVSVQRTWRFEETKDRWWHNALERLVQGLEVFTDPDPFKGTIASIRKRHEFAHTVRKRTIEGFWEKWNEAITSIANEEECPLYRGLTIKAQEGLIPIGQDPDSKLWEFAHRQTGEVPERDEDGKLVLTEEMGLVFVLLPGGTFKMGATRPQLGVELSETEGRLRVEEVAEGSLAARAGLEEGDVLLALNEKELKTREDLKQGLSGLSSGRTVSFGIVRRNEEKVLRAEVGPNVDPQADGSEAPLRDVTLAPFFLSKYEMTQGQWRRFTGENPSYYSSGNTYGGRKASLLDPVEQVSWEDCNGVLSRLGLVLPTEAQWEYGSRGGTATVWWTGNDRESLEAKVNLADQAAARAGARWPEIKDWPELDDGYVVHAPVGTYSANPFGLHEVHGNVWEWCRDWYGSSSLRLKTGDGERQVPPVSARSRVLRGACFNLSARYARSAYRHHFAPEIRYNSLGVRPARGVSTE